MARDPENYRAWVAAYREKHREKLNAARRAKYAANPERQRIAALEFYAKNRDYYKQVRAARKDVDRERERKYRPAYLANPEKRAQKREAARRWAKSSTPAAMSHRIRMRLRNRLYYALLGKGQRAGSAVRDLGCSLADLKTWLRVQMEPGMCWENYGAWHIDHVVPLAAFDLTDRGQFLEANNWKNLQPLWATENVRKGAAL